ncbi:general odorant-binding protein 56d [Monomorium pharaonis]|uniref:general odorant-binding protein 56d n=1 Tax=Monomorium pharaonis TaxID=307658 RepID=UPI00063F9F99|nr:general odorant-binding protein 56d [Monomorium pharaonis]
MKAIIIVLAISVIAVLGQLTDEQKAKLREHKESCISETGVDSTLIENAKKGDIAENDEKLTCFADCLLKKIGIINANGDIDWEVARAKMPPGVSQEQADHIHNVCKDITGTGCEKGGNLFKCFLDNKHFHLLS